MKKRFLPETDGLLAYSCKNFSSSFLKLRSLFVVGELSSGLSKSILKSPAFFADSGYPKVEKLITLQFKFTGCAKLTFWQYFY